MPGSVDIDLQRRKAHITHSVEQSIDRLSGVTPVHVVAEAIQSLVHRVNLQSILCMRKPKASAKLRECRIYFVQNEHLFKIV